MVPWGTVREALKTAPFLPPALWAVKISWGIIRAWAKKGKEDGEKNIDETNKSEDGKEG